jgi:hypothetical protein
MSGRPDDRDRPKRLKDKEPGRQPHSRTPGISRAKQGDFCVARKSRKKMKDKNKEKSTL